MLATCRLRFTQAADFNDPFELLPSFDVDSGAARGDEFLEQLEHDVAEYYTHNPASTLDDGESLTRLAEVIAKRLPLKRGVDPRDLVLSALEILPVRARLGYGLRIQRDFGDRLGILSLGETPDVLLMWAHYADCHRGFVVEFDADHAFFHQGLPDSHLGTVQPVRYSNERPGFSLGAEPMPGGVAHYLSSVLLTKSPEWSYEREWRMVVDLNDEARFPRDVMGRVHLFHVPPECITGVIFGNRCARTVRDRVFEILAANPALGHVEVRYSHLDPARFATRIDRSPWPTHFV